MADERRSDEVVRRPQAGHDEQSVQPDDLTDEVGDEGGSFGETVRRQDRGGPLRGSEATQTVTKKD